MTPDNSQLLKLSAWLFISLQAVVVWQGQRMVDAIDDLARAVGAGREQMATMAAELRGQDTRIDGIDERNKAADLMLHSLDRETRSQDRRITKLESKP